MFNLTPIGTPELVQIVLVILGISSIIVTLWINQRSKSVIEDNERQANEWKYAYLTITIKSRLAILYREARGYALLNKTVDLAAVAHFEDSALRHDIMFCQDLGRKLCKESYINLSKELGSYYSFIMDIVAHCVVDNPLAKEKTSGWFVTSSQSNLHDERYNRVNKAFKDATCDGLLAMEVTDD